MKLKKFREHLIPNLVLIIYFSIVVFTAIIASIQALRWFQTPFLGAFLEPTLHFKSVSKIMPNGVWPLQEKNWGLETQLISLDSATIQSQEEITSILSKHSIGDSISITVRQEGGFILSEQVNLIAFTVQDQWVYFILPFLGGLTSLIFAAWLISDQRRQFLTIAFAVLSASLALILFSCFDFFTTQRLVFMFYLGIAMTAGILIQIGILLPRKKRIINYEIIVSFLGFSYNIILAGIAHFQTRNPDGSLQHLRTLTLLLISLAVSILVMTLFAIFFRSGAKSPLLEKQVETLLGATYLSFIPIYTQLLVNFINGAEPPFQPLFLMPLIVLPITIGLIRKPVSLPQTGRQATRVGIFVAISILFGLVYAMIVIAINRIFLNPILPDSTFFIGSLIFITFLVFDPLRRRVAALLHLKPDSDSQEGVDITLDYTEKLIAAEDQSIALTILQDAITEIIQPSHYSLFIYSPTNPGFVNVETGRSSEPSQKVFISSDSSFVATLKELQSSLYLDGASKEANNLVAENEWMKELHTVLHVPIPGNFGLLGWVSLGEKQHNLPYTASDMRLLESLATQFALVYEHTDTLQAISHRLEEMMTLNQIALAINNTSDLDTLLLVILTQIKKIMPIDGLALIMERTPNDVYEQQFLYKNNRIIVSTQEPLSLPDEFPEKQAIIKGQTTVTNQDGDWLILPLRTDERVIGALSLGSAVALSFFESADINLLDSISNLVTGAIIKTRLLQVSQRQTHHLSLLNSVNRRLSSTLELEPLLNTIVESAIEILNGSTGILMILDEVSDEFVCKVTTGPLGPALQSRRIPKEDGIVGEAYRKHEPVILNKIQPEQMYFNQSLPNVIAEIYNMVAVPLIAQGEVVGILEILNKNKGLSFTDYDLVTLQGFASQAAVAMHNATLYSRTDQALERRIKELSTMQQIDRELHSSQGINPVLWVTLKAALSQTPASYGTIALVDTYNHRLENIWQIFPDREDPLQLESIDLNNFIWFSEENGSSFHSIDSAESELSQVLQLPKSCESHFLIQSQLEETQYAMLILHLENRRGLRGPDIEFLRRLNDHATIALRNATLYEDLQNAIQAKNEFISYISHELKNPLTAIKGHADILAKGMAGEISEEQADFLRTISHNVRRMNTFITDLSDQSHIETKSLRMIMESTEVNDLVDEVLQSFSQEIQAKNLSVHRQIADVLPNVWCDRLRLIQILANLVSNAIKYTPENGEIIIAAEHAINKWDQEGAAEVVHFWVKDTGYGIFTEDQQHLFEKFYRGTNDAILRIPGSGLGLRISKSLTEMMGGRMWFESESGKGSTFHFTVPI